MPDTLTIIQAIGLWHVHGHKEECLYRFASTYIPGVGVVDGEILETLWSLLNRISRTCRGMTTAHRTEVLDDHMGDSNWKKTINMGDHHTLIPHLGNRLTSILLASTLVKKYSRALTEQRDSREYFSGLTAQAPSECIPKVDVRGHRGGAKSFTIGEGNGHIPSEGTKT